MTMNIEMNSKVNKLANLITNAYREVSDGARHPDKEYTQEVAKALLFGIENDSDFGFMVEIQGLEKLL